MLGAATLADPMVRSGRPARYRPSFIRSSSRLDASSEVSRCAVDTGSPASRAISVSECSLPSVKVIRIEVILLVTERPDSVAFPANDLSRLRGSRATVSRRCMVNSRRAPGGWGARTFARPCWTGERRTGDTSLDVHISDARCRRFHYLVNLAMSEQPGCTAEWHGTSVRNASGSAPGRCRHQSPSGG